jgi:hypothetical protein
MTTMPNSSSTNSGSLLGNKPKIEPVAGTAKIIHPDDDISLVNLNFNMKKNQNHSLILFFLGRISCFFAEI